MTRAFPIIYVRDVPRALRFYGELLGFEEHYRFPPDGDEAVYVGLRRDDADIGIVHETSPQQLIGRTMGEGPRYELFIYVGDVDGTVGRLRAGDVPVLREPEDMPWGDRLAFVEDPEGNPVTLAAGNGASGAEEAA
jgi:lactoylglutathione lyase